jgi:hypothetical protein
MDHRGSDDHRDRKQVQANDEGDPDRNNLLATASTKDGGAESGHGELESDDDAERPARVFTEDRAVVPVPPDQQPARDHDQQRQDRTTLVAMAATPSVGRPVPSRTTRSRRSPGWRRSPRCRGEIRSASRPLRSCARIPPRSSPRVSASSGRTAHSRGGTRAVIRRPFQRRRARPSPAVRRLRCGWRCSSGVRKGPRTFRCDRRRTHP